MPSLPISARSEERSRREPGSRISAQLPSEQSHVPRRRPRRIPPIGRELALHRLPRAAGALPASSGAYKIDYALNGPMPWANPRLAEAGTIHLGSSSSIVAAEQRIWQGKEPERPFMLVAQPSIFDPTRAPEGRHTLWVYAHVPRGSKTDYRPLIERETGGTGARIQRKDNRPLHLHPGRPRGVQPQLARGGHHRGRPHFETAHLSTYPRTKPLCHPVTRGLSCVRLRLHRVLGCTGCAATGRSRPA